MRVTSSFCSLLPMGATSAPHAQLLHEWCWWQVGHALGGPPGQRWQGHRDSENMTVSREDIFFKFSSPLLQFLDKRTPEFQKFRIFICPWFLNTDSLSAFKVEGHLSHWTLIIIYSFENRIFISLEYTWLKVITLTKFNLLFVQIKSKCLWTIQMKVVLIKVSKYYVERLPWPALGLACRRAQDLRRSSLFSQAHNLVGEKTCQPCAQPAAHGLKSAQRCFSYFYSVLLLFLFLSNLLGWH